MPFPRAFMLLRKPNSDMMFCSEAKAYEWLISLFSGQSWNPKSKNQRNHCLFTEACEIINVRKCEKQFWNSCWAWRASSATAVAACQWNTAIQFDGMCLWKRHSDHPTWPAVKLAMWRSSLWARLCEGLNPRNLQQDPLNGPLNLSI